MMTATRLRQESCGNGTVCLNGGECNDEGTCVCPSGYGPPCEHTVMSVAILVVVCIMPLITWTIVCSYGCRSWRAKERRRSRRRARERSRRREATSDEDDGIPEHDDPPSYYHTVYTNPIAICGMDQNPDWTSSPDDYLELPPHYEDLDIAIKSSSELPPSVIIDFERIAGSYSRSGTDRDVTMPPICSQRSSEYQSSSSSATPVEIPRRFEADVEIGVEGTTRSLSHQRSSEDQPSSLAPPVEISRSGADVGADVEVGVDGTTHSPPNQEISEDEPSSSGLPEETPSGPWTDVEIDGETPTCSHSKQECSENEPSAAVPSVEPSLSSVADV